MNKTVLLLTVNIYPFLRGGALTRWRMCQYLSEKGYDVIVITFRGKDENKIDLVDGVKIIRPVRLQFVNVGAAQNILNTIWAPFFIGVCLYIYIYIFMNNDVDILKSVSYKFHPISKVIKILFDIPTVNFIGYSPSEVDGNKRAIFKETLEKVNMRLFMGDVVLCRMPKIREMILQRSDSDVRLVDGVVDSKHIHEVKGQITKEEKRDKELIFLGRLEPIKRPVELVEILKNIGDSYTLKIIGDGTLRSEIQDEIDKSSLGDQISLLGELRHEQALIHLARADALILTSKGEAYPTVVFEALALNKHVFSTKVGILPDIEHPKLHLSDLDNLDKNIMNTKIDNEKDINIDTLKKYSNRTYSEETRVVFEQLMSDHDNCR